MVVTRDVYTERGLDLDAIWIQTTAPISPGNSGGPLVNELGEVVGVTTWMLPGGKNLNFAVSALHLKQLAEHAAKSVKPPSDLPAPIRKRRGFSVGSAENTLEYWNKRVEIEQKMLDKQFDKRPKTIFTTKVAANQVFIRWLRALAKLQIEYAVQIFEMPIKGVDKELVLAFQEEAQVSRLMGGKYYELATLLKICDSTTVDNYACISQEFVNLSNRNEKVYYARLGELRIVFSKRYGVAFPNFSPIRPKKGKEVRKKADPGNLASNALSMAKTLLSKD